MLKPYLSLIAAVLLAAPLVAQTPAVVSVTDFGAQVDGTNALQTTAAFVKAFATNPTGEIDVPAGNYLLDNSNGPITILNFSGQLSFKGSAQLIFVNNAIGGLWFQGGTGARIQGLHATYQVAPVQRYVPQEEIKFSDTTDTSVSDIEASNSPSAGVLFYNCIRPKVTNALIRNTQGDGLHFANCQDAQATNITADNTGDDGLAFLNYAAYPDKTGGSAYNIVITNGHSRGISVVGQSNVVVSNFRVDTTASSGILCAYDSSYNTRRPANVQFSSGTINNAGSPNSPTGNNYGIEYNGQVSCSFSNITVTGSAGRGLAGTAPTGLVTVNNVQISQNKTGDAFSFFQTAQVQVNSSAANASPAYAFFFGQCGSVVAKGLTAQNAGQMGYLHRAIWFENNEAITASDMTVIDSQPSPTGYILGTYESSSGSQAGVINGITYKINGGTLSVQNQSRNVRLLNVTPQ